MRLCDICEKRKHHTEVTVEEHYYLCDPPAYKADLCKDCEKSLIKLLKEWKKTRMV